MLRRRKQKDIRHSFKSLADPQPTGWNFDQTQEVHPIPVNRHVTDQHTRSKRRKLNRGSQLKECTAASRRPRQAQQTIIIPDDEKTPSTTETTHGSPWTTPFSSHDVVAVHVDGDGDVENTKTSFVSETGFRDLRINQSLAFPNIGNYHQGRRDSYVSLSSESSEEDPKVSIFHQGIADLFPIDKKLNPGPGDRLSEDEVNQRLKDGHFGNPQFFNDYDRTLETEDDEAKIEANLQSLVISRPTNTSRDPDQHIPPLMNTKIHALSIEDIHTGETVELHDGSFIRVDSVHDHHDGNWAVIKGYKLERDIRCGRKFPDQRVNELIWITEIDGQEHKAGLDSVLEEVPFFKIKRIRTVIFTNQPYSDLNFLHGLAEAQQKKEDIDRPEAEENGPLFCRWRYVQVHNKLKTDAEASISLLNYNDATVMGCLEPADVRQNWRGNRASAPGGSCIKKLIDRVTQEEKTVQQYTLGDCFCGAGGVSRGAIEADLHVAWAFDKSACAIRAHGENFRDGGTKSILTSDARFIRNIEEKGYYADVVHYSPPCQGFSSANHNHNFDLDLLNRQALFSTQEMTEKLKPRIVTMEETAGLLHRHGLWFDVLINIFVSLGYGVRWKIIRCSDFGIPQSRARLVLIAAAPGERLPRFPDATHGDTGSGLKSYVTINDAISDIPERASHQEMRSECKTPESLKAFDGNTFAKCITTGGGQHNHHPKGGRKYNVRELACLQCFPTSHYFTSKGIGEATKQVGNAVPPPLAKAMFQEVVKSLQETDKALKQWGAEYPSNGW